MVARVRDQIVGGLVLAACMLWGWPAGASEATSLNLGQYTVEDFARLPKFQQVGLSKEGTYFSAISKGMGPPFLLIENMDVPDAEPYLVGADDWNLRWYRWLSDTRLILSVGFKMYFTGTPVVVTRLMLIDVPQRKITQLFRNERGEGFRQIQDDFVGVIPDKPDRILIGGNPDYGNKQVYLARLSTRKLPNSPYKGGLRGVYDWYADAMGEVRVGLGFNDNQTEPVIKLRDGDGKWREYHNFVEDLEVLGLPSDQPDIMYVQVPGPGEFREVRALTVSTGELGEVIASHPQSDVASLIMNDEGTAIDYVIYESDLVENDYRHPLLRNLVSVANKNFDDTYNYIAAFAADKSRVLIGAVSAALPRHYYLYDGASKSINYVGATYPGLVENAPGRVHKVLFSARDGLQIPGYVTLPKDISIDEASGLPFVVYPHGGPAARDFMTFDWMAQMMTAAGYGVLQINFRGSTGYGLEFEKAGRKQWGQAMQDDVTDGTQWLIDEGLADPDRICIFGGSYGGYAALMGVAKEPELYTCAASLNGVTDLRGLIRSSQRYVGGKFGTRFIGRLWKDRQMLRENSPFLLADQIQRPVLLVHGEKDLVVPVSQSRKMHRALGDQLYQYVELEEGDHSVTNPANRLLFANTLMQFLAEHLAQPPARATRAGGE